MQTEDFQRLEVETERKRIAYEKLHAAAGLMQIQLAKKKPSPEDNNKSKRLPNDILGVCLTNYGSEFTDDTAPLGVALNNFGHAQSKLGHYQEDYAERMKTDYLEKLEEGLTMFKEYSNLRKKLESRRLDYDAKLGRLQKSKKEKPELEQELQASKMKYEDSEYDVIQKMVSLQEFEDEHCEALQQFLELQYDYFSRSLEVLNEVRSNWGQSLPSTGRQTSNNRLNNLSRTSSNNSSTMNEEMTRSPRLPLSRKASAVEVTPPPMNGGSRRLPTQRSLSFSDREDNSYQPSPRAMVPPPVLPRRQSQASTGSSITQRKAVYDFAGDNLDELSFRTGEVITVIEEVDEGWWLGEIGDRRGIFPVNYTELILSHSSAAGPPSMPSRPSLSSTTTSASNIIVEHPEEYYVEEPARYQDSSSPFGDSNRSLAPTTTPRSYTRPNQPTRTLSANTAGSLPSPMGSPIPRPQQQQQQNGGVAKRAPPPPPPSSRSVNVRPTTARTAPTTPQTFQQQQDSYFESTPACGDCGCNEFVANIFKKGHCNNCFHKH